MRNTSFGSVVNVIAPLIFRVGRMGGTFVHGTWELSGDFDDSSAYIEAHSLFFFSIPQCRAASRRVLVGALCVYLHSAHPGGSQPSLVEQQV